MTQERRRLPDERKSITHKFSVAGHEGYVTVGMYPDGSPGEIFLVMAKEGSTMSGLLDAFAITMSMALQYGVPLHDLVAKLSHMRFEPAGFTPNQSIPFAKSVVDYIVRWLATKFLDAQDQFEIGVLLRDKQDRDVGEIAEVSSATTSFQNDQDAPSCPSCGSIMVRSGSCYRCLNCGSTSGCS